jgi:hypothetical protein
VSRTAPAAAIAAAACLAMAVLLLYLAGRPLDTSDMWWHLAMGEVYANEGPWPDGDPLLHTAHADAPIQHEWIFGVALHGIERLGGFYGLRAAHAVTVAAVLWFAYALFRRRAGPGSTALAGACLATCVFITLSWWRLFQLRPDLLSIAATLLLYHLLLAAPEPPSRGRIAAAALLMGVWANAHSLFAVGLALLVAALLGLALQSLLGRTVHLPGEDGTPLRVRRLLEALALGSLISLLNPRGVSQHLTFFTSSRDAAIWFVRDEWTHFAPFRWGHYAGSSVSFTSWLVADVLLVLFLLGSAAALIAHLRRPSRAALERFDPVLFGLSLAAIAAIGVSVRFLWLAFFPLLYLLQLVRLAPAPAALPWAASAACVALLAAFPSVSGFERDAARPSAYLARPYSPAGYDVQSARFLASTGVEGNLFNDYGQGGFLGYWLAPKLRSFIDSRTEHYSAAVYRDYSRVNRQIGGRPGWSFLDVLDKYRVDFFLGSGLPSQRDLSDRAAYTTAHLERAPGWLLVFRTVDAAIYLRRGERNRANLERIAAWYEREGVPFDRERGLDVAAVIEARPDWAIQHQMLPRRYQVLQQHRLDPDPERRFAALDGLGAAYAALGAYRLQLAVDREAVTLRPDAAAPRLRMVYALLRLDRRAKALAQARALSEIDPEDRRSEIFLRTARAARTARIRRPGAPRYSPEGNRRIGELPLFTLVELDALFAGRYELAGPSPDPDSSP